MAMGSVSGRISSHEVGMWRLFAHAVFDGRIANPPQQNIMSSECSVSRY